MIETYFNVRYAFDKKLVCETIDRYVNERMSTYVCVADGVILNIANRNPEYLKIVNGSAFSICDSSYVPMYLKWIYGINREQYCGSQIFMDLVKMKKYRMFFMGTSTKTLAALKENLVKIDSRIADMTFYELPFRSVDQFDYQEIADKVNADGADIIWVALGAPKQEVFMSLLRPHLRRGVMIAVGAVFKFYSGTDERRAPEWMVRMHMEFVFRILSEPKKQLRRCWGILTALPSLLYGEWRRKRQRSAQLEMQ